MVILAQFVQDYLINHCKSGGYNKSETGGFVSLI